MHWHPWGFSFMELTLTQRALKVTKTQCFAWDLGDDIIMKTIPAPDTASLVPGTLGQGKGERRDPCPRALAKGAVLGGCWLVFSFTCLILSVCTHRPAEMVTCTGTEAVQPRDAHIFIAPAVVQRAVPELICAWFGAGRADVKRGSLISSPFSACLPEGLMNRIPNTSWVLYRELLLMGKWQ